METKDWKKPMSGVRNRGRILFDFTPYFDLARIYDEEDQTEKAQDMFALSFLGGVVLKDVKKRDIVIDYLYEPRSS